MRTFHGEIQLTPKIKLSVYTDKQYPNSVLVRASKTASERLLEAVHEIVDVDYPAQHETNLRGESIEVDDERFLHLTPADTYYGDTPSSQTLADNTLAILQDHYKQLRRIAESPPEKPLEDAYRREEPLPSFRPEAPRRPSWTSNAVHVSTLSVGPQLEIHFSYRDEQSGNLLVSFKPPQPREIKDCIFKIILHELNENGKLNATRMPEEDGITALWADQRQFQNECTDMRDMVAMARMAVNEHKQDILDAMSDYNEAKQRRDRNVEAMKGEMKKTLIGQRSLQQWLKPGNPASEALIEYLAKLVDQNREKIRKLFDPAKRSTRDDPHFQLINMALQTPAKDAKAAAAYEALRASIGGNPPLAAHIAMEFTQAIHNALGRSAATGL